MMLLILISNFSTMHGMQENVLDSMRETCIMLIAFPVRRKRSAIFAILLLKFDFKIKM